MLSLNVRTPVPENNHTSHRVQGPSLIWISQQEGAASRARPTKKTSHPSHSKFEIILNYPTRSHSTERSTHSAAQLQEFQQAHIIRCQTEVDFGVTGENLLEIFRGS